MEGFLIQWLQPGVWWMAFDLVLGTSWGMEVLEVYLLFPLPSFPSGGSSAEHELW